MKTAILADNQEITKAGILYFLNIFGKIEKIQEAESKKKLIGLLTQYHNALVILDYTLFDFSDPRELMIASARFPSVHWLLFSDELSDGFLHDVLVNSTSFSVLFKDASKKELYEAIEYGIRNERYICRRASHQLAERRTQTAPNDQALTATEKDILRLLALGKTTKQIATERFSSTHTITTHRKNIFRKLEVNTVYEATKYALKAGIIDSAEYYI